MTQVRRATAQTAQLREELAAFGDFTSPVAYPEHLASPRKLAGLAALHRRRAAAQRA